MTSPYVRRNLLENLIRVGRRRLTDPAYAHQKPILIKVVAEAYRQLDEIDNEMIYN